MVRLKARKYFLVEAESEKEAVEKVKKILNSDLPYLDDEAQKLLGLSIDIDEGDIEVTSVVEDIN